MELFKISDTAAHFQKWTSGGQISEQNHFYVCNLTEKIDTHTLNFIPGLRWTGRRPRTRTSQTMSRTETTVLEQFLNVGGRGCPVDVLRRPASHNTFTKTRTFSKIAVLVSHRPRPGFRPRWPYRNLKNGVLGRSRPCPIGNGLGRLVGNWN